MSGNVLTMLVAVQEPAWLTPFDIGVERPKPLVDVSVAFMHTRRRVMSDKEIGGGVVGQHRCDLVLFEHVMALVFVFPTAGEAAETKTAVFLNSAMQVDDTGWEWTLYVVVAAHAKRHVRAIMIDGSADSYIMKVAES